MRLLHVHGAGEVPLDVDGDVSLLHHDVVGTGPVGELEANALPLPDDPDPCTGVEPPRGRLRDSQELDRSIADLDHDTRVYGPTCAGDAGGELMPVMP